MKQNYSKGLRRLLLPGIVLALSAAQPLAAQYYEEDQWYDPTDWFDGNNVEWNDTYGGYYGYDDYNSQEWEYQSGEGWHEEEWYDPSDWGYDGTYNIETDWDDYGTGYDYGYDYWDNTWYNAGYWDDYDWYSDYNSAWDDDVGVVIYDYPLGNQRNQQNRQQQSAQQRSNRQGASMAQMSNRGQQGQTQQRQSQMQRNQSQGQTARLGGTIQGLRTMRLRRDGQTATYTLARVELDNGRTTVVNLGRRGQRDLNLQEGDDILAIGRRGMIDGQSVFVAQQLQFNGRTVQVAPSPIASERGQRSQRQQSGQMQQQRREQSGDRSGSQQMRSRVSQQNESQRQNQQRQASASQQRMIQGEVASLNRIRPQGEQSDHTFVRLQLENGQTTMVNFGPFASPDKIGLEPGDKVTIRGRQKEIGGRNVLIAERVRIDGERISASSRN